MYVLGWILLALLGGTLAYRLLADWTRLRPWLGVFVAMLGAACGAVAGRYLEWAEEIDYVLEDFGNTELDDFSTWIVTVAGGVVALLVARALVGQRDLRSLRRDDTRTDERD
jgi:hypothetical protein